MLCGTVGLDGYPSRFDVELLRPIIDISLPAIAMLIALGINPGSDTPD
jgi:hypothetical protein